MEARYLTDEDGKRLFVVLDIEEYERLLELEDEMENLEDLEHLQAAEQTKAAIKRGEEEIIPWEEVRDKIGSEYEGPQEDGSS